MQRRMQMSAPFGAFSFVAIFTSAAILLALGAAIACQSRGSMVLPPPAPDSMAGDWNFTSTTSTDTCDLGASVQPFQGFLHFAVDGTTLGISNLCCQALCSLWGTGSIDGDQVILQKIRKVVPVNSTCSWQIDETDTATLDITGSSEFGGTVRMDVSAVGDCGSGFPCQIDGAFLAERCPSTGCGLSCPLR